MRGKFRELAPILTVRGMSLRMKGKIYRTCAEFGGFCQCDLGAEGQRDATAERMMVRLDVWRVVEGKKNFTGVVGQIGYCWG